MGRRVKVGWCVALVLAFVTAGCGSGTNGGSSTSSVDTTEPPGLSRGIKGESASEAATDAHLSAGDCAALARLAERRNALGLARRSTPGPPLSRCRLDGHGVSINAYLDSGFAAARRYRNRITETVQFNTQHPAGLPRPVPGVGEKAAYDADASWIPALGSLLAVRGNRWLTVTISVAGWPDRRLRREAAVLARAGFRLSAR